jgi:hypothetical protein
MNVSYVSIFVENADACMYLGKPGKAVEVDTLGNDKLFFTSIASAGQALGLALPIDAN